MIKTSLGCTFVTSATSWQDLPNTKPSQRKQREVPPSIISCLCPSTFKCLDICLSKIMTESIYMSRESKNSPPTLTKIKISVPTAHLTSTCSCSQFPCYWLIKINGTQEQSCHFSTIPSMLLPISWNHLEDKICLSPIKLKIKSISLLNLVIHYIFIAFLTLIEGKSEEDNESKLFDVLLPLMMGLRLNNEVIGRIHSKCLAKESIETEENILSKLEKYITNNYEEV